MSISEAVESGRTSPRPMSPEEFAEIRARLEENGRLGEEFVLAHERRSLRRAGRPDLASRVRWISIESVNAGYDIRSFSEDGKEKFVEVKATVGKSRTFEMTANEWRTCRENNAKYHIYRVTRVRERPRLEIIRDVLRLEAEGRITRSAIGWWVTVT